jgi:hypothetical protein
MIDLQAHSCSITLQLLSLFKCYTMAFILRKILMLGVITEILSATLHTNGYRNTTIPTTISSHAALKCIQKEKNYTIGSKIDMHKFTKGSAHNVCRPTNPSACTMHQVSDCVQEKLCTSMNDAFMDLVGPSTTYGPAPNTI